MQRIGDEGKNSFQNKVASILFKTAMQKFFPDNKENKGNIFFKMDAQQLIKFVEFQKQILQNFSLKNNSSTVCIPKFALLFKLDYFDPTM